jgi:ABC-2 type transport system ATP-binding protein
MPNNGVALSVQQVRKTFTVGKRHITALEQVSFTVKLGRVTGLIGPDAAGKTTLMRLAAGLLVPDNGRIEVLGLDSQSQALQVQMRVGYMPQRFGLYEDLSVQENLDLYANLQSVPREQRRERYARLMRMTELGSFTRRLAGQLSGGMKQKLGLACTLVRAPRLLLLDEPTVGVDPVSRRELWSIVYELVESEAVTVLLSTAYLDEAERCHKVVLLHEGRVLDTGTPAEFTQRLHRRTYRAPFATQSKRQLHRDLSAVAGVIDCVIQSDGVRLVTRSEDTAPPEVEETTVEPVAPRFEDAFVARLAERRESIASFLVESSEMGAERSTKTRQGDEEVIRVRNLQRRFGDFLAVRGIDFSTLRGEVFGLLGANGAGKTTTFRMLCGLLPPSGGEAFVAGHDLRKAAAAARADIGYMSQRFALYPNLTVTENLNFFAHAYGLHGRRHRQRRQWALESFGLAEVAAMPTGDLPLGFKQRLALAAALMHSPAILFLDEPTSGADPLARRSFWARINALAESGVTVMVTTHFMEEAEYCDRLAIMAEGKILALDTPEAIRSRTQGDDETVPAMEEAFIRLIQSQAEEAKRAS